MAPYRLHQSEVTATVSQRLAASRASLAYDQILLAAAQEALRRSRRLLDGSLPAAIGWAPLDEPPAAPRPCCLMVEDEALIAMALEDDLDALGFDVVGAFPTGADALDWLARQGDGTLPAVALLDLTLKDGPCVALARQLLGRGVPVVICSGHVQAWPGLPPDLRGAVGWIDKPIAPRALREALARFTAARAQAPARGA